MGDQKDKAATRKTYIKKTSISKVLPKKCMSNAIFANYGQYVRSSPILREICYLRRDLRRLFSSGNHNFKKTTFVKSVVFHHKDMHINSPNNNLNKSGIPKCGQIY